MRIELTLSPGGDVPAVLAEAVRAEHVGVRGFNVGEATGFDAVSLLGALTARTESAVIGSAVLPVQSRSVALLAMTAAGLDAIGGGRFRLGLGASGPRVVTGWHGLDDDPALPLLRSAVADCRAIWRGEPAPGPAGETRLRMSVTPRRPEIPVALAGLGPRSAELAAAVADVWLPMIVWPERMDGVWGEALAAGRAARTRPNELEVVAGVPFGLEPTDRLAARRRLARFLGAMGPAGRNHYRRLAARYDFGAEAERVGELFAARRQEQAVAAVPDELVEATCLLGDPAAVEARLAAFAAAGVEALSIVALADSATRRIAELEWLARAAARVPIAQQRRTA